MHTGRPKTIGVVQSDLRWDARAANFVGFAAIADRGRRCVRVINRGEFAK